MYLILKTFIIIFHKIQLLLSDVSFLFVLIWKLERSGDEVFFKFFDLGN